MVSVLVLSWNAQAEVLACVRSIQQALLGIEHEIIVIENASADGSAAALEVIPGIQLIKNSTNLGYAGGNNQAYALAKGDLIWLLNQDTIVNAGAATSMIHWLQHHPDYAGATVKLLNPDGSTQYYMHRRLPRWYMIPLALLHKRLSWFRPRSVQRYLYLDQAFTEDFDIEQAAGTCILLRRSTIQQLGYLFDEQRFPLYYNDVDLCRRIHDRGLKIRCICSQSIMHLKGTSVRKLPKLRNLAIYLQALRYYFLKW